MLVPAIVNEWLDAFAAAVTEERFDHGRSLFDDDVVAYGTRRGVMAGLDTLVQQQWTPVWTHTHGFGFSNVDAVLGSPAFWVVAARWHSWSRLGALREGRCTLVLTGDPLACRHSHFSLTPQDGGRIETPSSDEAEPIDGAPQ